jgi:FkbM family methyltransferase
LVPAAEGLGQVGTLDFPDKPIYLSLHSVEELGRLKACHKEPETVSWLRMHMAPDMVFYDIGANVGAYSFVADAICEASGLVYAFEPSYSTFASLCKNVLLNKAQRRIIPLMFALGSETRLATLAFSSTAPGAAFHSIDVEINLERPALFVPGGRLDELVQIYRLRPPNLIKLDVDGNELDVLRGSTGLLGSSSISSILVEVDEADPSCTVIRDLLGHSGFVLGSRHPHGDQASVANHIYVRE